MKKITLSKKGEILGFSAALIFILVGAILRILPHPPNFTPIVALALFGGVYLSRKTAFIIPIAAMLISDRLIGFYQLELMASVYGSFLLSVILGFWLKRHKKWYTITGSSIVSSFLFFIITNFAVWAFTPWYVKTFSGLIESYVMGLPFLRNTILGDLSYVVIFFGAYEAARIWIEKRFTISKETPVLIK